MRLVLARVVASSSQAVGLTCIAISRKRLRIVRKLNVPSRGSARSMRSIVVRVMTSRCERSSVVAKLLQFSAR